MSDDGDTALGTQEERDAAIDLVLDAAVAELSDTLAYQTREIYDGLIRAARTLRHGRNLTDFT